MTLEQYFEDLEKKLLILENGDFLRPIVQDTHAEHVKQLFRDGESKSGSKDKYKDGSYKKLREKKGRQVAFVDMNFEGDLFSDFATSLQKLDGAWVTGTKRPFNSDKISGMIKLYGEDRFMLKDTTAKKFIEKVKKRVTEIL